MDVSPGRLVPARLAEHPGVQAGHDHGLVDARVPAPDFQALHRFGWRSFHWVIELVYATNGSTSAFSAARARCKRVFTFDTLSPSNSAVSAVSRWSMSRSVSTVR